MDAEERAALRTEILRFKEVILEGKRIHDEEGYEAYQGRQGIQAAF